MVEAESGRIAITITPTAAHLNPWGTVHGGLTATLLDSCMGLAMHSMLDKGLSSTTLEFKISLVRAITLDSGQSGPKAKSLTVAVVLPRRKAASWTSRVDCSRTVQRPVLFFRANEALYRILSVMSASGQKQHVQRKRSLSALPLIAT